MLTLHPSEVREETERRVSTSRRKTIDTKFLGMGKCIDRREGVRRKSDQFDEEAWERLCYKNLGPGWL